MIRRRIKVTSITVTRRDLDKNKFRSGLSGASWQRVKIMNIFKKAKMTTADTMAPRKLTLAERKELEAMEETILVAEEEVATREEQLNDADFQAANFAKIPELVSELDQKRAAVAKLYTRWEELEALAS